MNEEANQTALHLLRQRGQLYESFWVKVPPLGNMSCFEKVSFWQNFSLGEQVIGTDITIERLSQNQIDLIRVIIWVKPKLLNRQQEFMNSAQLIKVKRIF